MYRQFIPTLCLAVSSTSLSFQLFVVYPNQTKIHSDLCAIRKLLQGNTIQKKII